ncbi:MAG: hypothetical protein ACRDD2_05050 [Sarcina sp.]
MYRRKKAITLLETVIYLGLLSVVISLFSFSTMYFKEKDYEVKKTEELLAIRDFLIDIKLQSRKENKMALVYFSHDGGVIKGKVGSKSAEILKLETVKVKDHDRRKEIELNDRDGIENNYEINFIDKKNEEYKFIVYKKGEVKISEKI